MSGCPFLNGEGVYGNGSSTAGAASHTATTTTNTTTTTAQKDENNLLKREKSILGLRVNESIMKAMDGSHATHYGSYLGIETLTKLQDGPASGKPLGKGLMHREELTFIIVHQAFELWFKLILSDLRHACKVLANISAQHPATANVPNHHITECNDVVRTLRRVDLIIQQSLGGFSVLETMQPGEFLEFRDYLVPASGFQSVAFRSMEQLLGIPEATRALVNDATVLSYLTEEEQQQLRREADELPSLNKALQLVLQRVEVPGGFVATYLCTAGALVREQQELLLGGKRRAKKRAREVSLAAGGGSSSPHSDSESDTKADGSVLDPANEDVAKLSSYVDSRVATLRATLQDPVAFCPSIFLKNEDEEELFRRSVIAALYVLIYREDHTLAPMAAMLDAALAVEEATLHFRSRHALMVERVIGRRGGTGGSKSGVGYLGLTQQYRAFAVLWLVHTLLIRPSAMPPLSSYSSH